MQAPKTLLVQRQPSMFTLMLLAACSALIGMFGVWLVPLLHIESRMPLVMPTAAPTRAAILPAFDPVRAPDCTVVNISGTYALIRSAPRNDFSLIGVIMPSGDVQTLGHTSNGWYAVNYAERLGWISSSVVMPTAASVDSCAALPLFRNPVIPDAPADPYSQVLSVDRDGGGSLDGDISTPGGDISDLIWIAVINLYRDPPNNYREMTLRLTCDGDNAQEVRWGSIHQPTLRCGDTIALPFLVTASRQVVRIEFAPDTPQAYIRYRLEVLQPVG